MKKNTLFAICIAALLCVGGIFLLSNQQNKDTADHLSMRSKVDPFSIDSSKIPQGEYGEYVKYGRELLLHTAHYIGPEGINGRYATNRISCSNCHQDAGTKPYSFNLETTFRNYPQYRAREGKVLSLQERINNCLVHPLLGKPLPPDSKEMNAIVCYLKWINDSSNVTDKTPGVKNKQIEFPEVAASSQRGQQVYTANCARCHGENGQGQMMSDSFAYVYPPLWGLKSYQPGSSMHRVIKMAQWLVSNMPYDKATHEKPFLTPAQALDVAAFVNDDDIHRRPAVKNFDYPDYRQKAIDYDRAPFDDTFSVAQHKFGPYKPIIDYRKTKKLYVSY